MHQLLPETLPCASAVLRYYSLIVTKSYFHRQVAFELRWMDTVVAALQTPSLFLTHP
jgi:hypothetical protein